MAELQCLEFYLDPFTIAPGQKFRLGFTVENLGAATGVLEARLVASNAWIISVADIGVIGHRSQKKVIIEVRPHARQENFSKYPLTIDVEIKQGARVLTTVKVLLKAENMVGLLRELKLKAGRDKMRILIFGEAGSGKTSLLYTILSALQGRLVRAHKKLGPAMSSIGHASVTMRHVDMSDRIDIIDPWGAEPGNYTGNELEMILTGLMPDDWRKDDRIDYTSDVVRRRLASGADKREKPDAVFFTITNNLVQDPGYLARLKSWIAIMQRTRTDLNPYLLLTKIDEVDATLRENPTLTNVMLDDCIVKVSAETGIPEMNIFPVLAYTKERENSDVIDRLVLNALYTACTTAIDAV